MNLHKFIILNESSDHGIKNSEVEILLNLDHIVSLKPIKLIASDQRVLEGYWIRMTNGKKYRATQIPMVVGDRFDSTQLQRKTVASFDTEETLLQ